MWCTEFRPAKSIVSFEVPKMMGKPVVKLSMFFRNTRLFGKKFGTHWIQRLQPIHVLKAIYGNMFWVRKAL